jgi:hypothetical protein
MPSSLLSGGAAQDGSVNWASGAAAGPAQMAGTLQRMGIDNPPGVAPAAFQQAARSVMMGGHVEQVLDDLLRDQPALRPTAHELRPALEQVAARGPALEKAKAGVSGTRAAFTAGVSDAALIRSLKNVTVLAQSDNPEWQALARDADLSDPHQAAQLEQAAARGPALAAIRGGQTPWAAIEEHGISDPALKSALLNVAALQ